MKTIMQLKMFKCCLKATMILIQWQETIKSQNNIVHQSHKRSQTWTVAKCNHRILVACLKNFPHLKKWSTSSKAFTFTQVNKVVVCINIGA